jgi:4-hydroxybenzoate polyprenyltransferase
MKKFQERALVWLIIEVLFIIFLGYAFAYNPWILPVILISAFIAFNFWCAKQVESKKSFRRILNDLVIPPYPVMMSDGLTEILRILLLPIWIIVEAFFWVKRRFK